jgi:hypothetical protein
MPPRLIRRDLTNSVVLRGVANPSFTQQGSLDWAAIARSTLEVGWYTLRRLSNHNVDADTVIYCQYLGSGMIWSRPREI